MTVEGEHRDRPHDGHRAKAKSLARSLNLFPGAGRTSPSGGARQSFRRSAATAWRSRARWRANPKVLAAGRADGGHPAVDHPRIWRELLRDIRSIRNICIVVCEQLLSFVLDVADRILVMEGGRIVHADTRENVDEAAIAQFLSV
jgi:ABC-type microcin C transport system duplicated ATPase subunit YejF